MKSIVHYLTILSKLTRVYLSLAVAFSAYAGSLLFNHAFTKTSFYTFLGVFLLSAAASALNQYQERNSDKKNVKDPKQAFTFRQNNSEKYNIYP